VSSPTPPRKNTPQIRSSVDFARYVGLARTTVSRVLNGQPGLKKKTIERVQRAIEETGFVPNAYALHLKGKRTATVGVCLETLLTPPLISKLAGLQKRLRDQNYATLIEVLEPGNARKVIRHFLSMRVEAVVFIGYFDEDQIAGLINELNSSATPHLLVDHAGIRNANTVALDRIAAMRELTEHLLNHGHRTFGLLAFSGTVRSTRDRLQGIGEALTAADLELEQCTRVLDYLHVRNNDFDYGRLLAKSFVESRNLPSAMVALNDEIAIGAMHALQEAGFRVPHDISVTGFNNQDICMMTTPTLTSVDQRVEATVDVAAKYILGQIGQPLKEKPALRMIEPQLVVRESSGPAAKAPLR
jgi:DNA-binding LacI/PurR family transcriptional regulator